MSGSAEITRSALQARIARARQLAVEHPATAELLSFYAHLAEFQQELLSETAHVLPDTSLRGFADALDPAKAAALVARLLRWLAVQPVPPLATTAATLAGRADLNWQPRLHDQWTRPAAPGEGLNDVEQFVVEVLLQPFAETLGHRYAADAPDESVAENGPPRRSCPLCGGRPVVATLRERGHGAHRSLVCGFCLLEWPALRVECVACGERDFAALPVYRAPELAHVRLDACDSCKSYIKAIDLTLDARAIAVVDDLSSLATDLWAAERGYAKVRCNLLRV